MGLNKIVRSLAAMAPGMVGAAAGVLAATALAFGAGGAVPKYDHVLVVIMENHSFNQIFQTGAAAYLRKLAKGGAVFTRSFGVTHPSQPNYFALFSGSTQGVTDDHAHDFTKPNLVTRLIAAHKTFAGYIEAGSPRKHNPWESFADAKAFERPLADFPSDFRKLPAVAFVIPNLQNDMHDGSIRRADAWLRDHLGGYAEWAKHHNSLLIVTFDEDDNASENRILTIFYGARIRAGQYSEKIDHYAALRTIEEIEGVAPLGISADRVAISGVWAAP